MLFTPENLQLLPVYHLSNTFLTPVYHLSTTCLPAQGMPYNFAYGVKDDYAGTDFGQEENSDGNTVKGSYSVQLPDGRKQTVSPLKAPLI